MESVLEKHRQEAPAAPEGGHIIRDVTSAASSFMHGFSTALHHKQPAAQNSTKTPAPQTGADAV